MTPDLARLAKRFGTPLYVYDFDALERRAADLRAALAPRFTGVYAVKANPSLAVVSFLGVRGFGADVASKGELATVLRAEVSRPSQIEQFTPVVLDHGSAPGG